MALQILRDKWAQRNDAELVLLREAQHGAHQLGPNALPLKAVGYIGVDQAKKIVVSFVEKKRSSPIRMEFKAVKSRVVGNFRLRHDSIVVCRVYSLLSCLDRSAALATAQVPTLTVAIGFESDSIAVDNLASDAKKHHHV